MMEKSEGPIDQIDMSQTIDLPLREVWHFLFSKQGLEIWLGTSQLDKWETGIRFNTNSGLEGVVRVFTPYSHIRLSWQLADSKIDSIVQIRAISLGDKTKIQIHQEKLSDSKQKKQMERYWIKVLEDVNSALQTMMN